MQWHPFKFLLDRMSARADAQKQFVLLSNDLVDKDGAIAVGDPMPMVVLGTCTSAGVFTANDASGRMPVVEQNSAAILLDTAAIELFERYNTPSLFFGVAPSGGTALARSQHQLDIVQFTATAGGEIAAADLVAAVADYQACCLIHGFFSDQTDASIALALTVSAGTLKGPNAWTIATTANTITHESALGVPFQASDDNVAIQLDCAAGEAGNAQNLYVIIERWYET